MQDQTPPAAAPETAAATTPAAPAETTEAGINLTDPDAMLSWIGDFVLTYGPRILGVLVLMAIAWVLANWARRSSRRALARTKFDPTLGKFLSNVLRWVILVLAALTCFSVFGITATSFAAVIGAVTLAIGLGFQSSLSNLAAGVMLLIFRPFKVGDVVNIAGQLGKVNEIDLMITEVDTFDGRRINIPNGQIFGNVIENITYHPRRRVDVNVGVHYDADIDATRATLEAALKTIEPRLDDPAPELVLQGLGASSVDWTMRVWTKREDFFATRQATIRAAKYALDNAGITIPFPQMDVHLKLPGGERSVRVVMPEEPAGNPGPR